MEENFNQNESNISFRDIFFLFKKNIILILIITILATVIGGVYAVGFKSTTFTTSATAMVIVPSESDNENKKVDYSYALNLMHTFEDLIHSNAVLKRVSDNLSEKYDIKVSTNYVKNCIQTEMQQYSLIIPLKVSTTVSSDFTRDLANAVFDELVYHINNELKSGDTLPLANTLVVVDYSEDVSASKGTLIVVIIAFVVGLILSIIVVFIKDLLNDTYVSKDEFERTTGVSILASIPEQNVGGKKYVEDK